MSVYSVEPTLSFTEKIKECRRTITKTEDKELIYDLLERLPDERMCCIVKMRNDLAYNKKVLTLKEVGKLFEISGERVRQLEIKAYRRMFDYIF